MFSFLLPSTMDRRRYPNTIDSFAILYGAIMSTIVEDIKKLSVSERIELVEDIWNSIAEEPLFSPYLSW